MNHHLDETLDSSFASSFEILSVEDDFWSHVVKRTKAKNIINQGKEFPNLEDVQINEPVKITSPKLNKEANFKLKKQQVA